MPTVKTTAMTIWYGNSGIPPPSPEAVVEELVVVELVEVVGGMTVDVMFGTVDEMLVALELVIVNEVVVPLSLSGKQSSEFAVSSVTQIVAGAPQVPGISEIPPSF